MRLDGARILVAGASGALGGLIAGELAGRGARLALTGRDAERLEAAAARTGEAAHVAADLREPGAPERVVAAASEALGGLDGVVCAIGVVAFGDARDVEDSVLAKLFETNVVAPVRLMRAGLAELERGGVIVNLSAITAELPTAGMAAYSASKAALTAFDVAAARELRRAEVRIIDVRPPHLDTGLERRAIAGEPPRLPKGRDPAELARRVADAMADDRATEVCWDEAAPPAAAARRSAPPAPAPETA